MQSLTRPTPSEPWVALLFSAQAVRKGAVVRRSRAWVDREVGRDRFLREVQMRGYRLIETGSQFIVICHNGPSRILF